MSTEVTVTLADELWERVQLWANHTGRPTDEFLAESIELSLSPLGEVPKPIGEWTDEEIKFTAELQLPADQDRRLSELLEAQREGILADREKAELSRLMVVYQEGLLRKAIALREAVRRGLREPPSA